VVTPATSGGSGNGLPVLGTNLPFTGLQVWILLLVAAGLLASGSTIRKTAHR
jgi:hypothetical protein